MVVNPPKHFANSTNPNKHALYQNCYWINKPIMYYAETRHGILNIFSKFKIC